MRRVRDCQGAKFRACARGVLSDASRESAIWHNKAMEDRFMRHSLIAAVLFGGFLAETALPVIAAAQTQKQTTEPADP